MPSVDINAYGGNGNGIADNTAALNNAIAAAYSQQIRMVTFGIGRYRFLSAPAAIASGMWLVGANRPETMLIRDFDGPIFLTWQGGSTPIQNVYGAVGGGIRNFHIVSAAGRSNGIAIYLNADSQRLPLAGMLVVDNIEVYGEPVSGPNNGSWYVPLYIDGSQNASSPGYGIRDVFVRGSAFMDGTSAGIFVNNGVACYFNDVAIYPNQHGPADFFVYATGTQYALSSTIMISNTNILGSLKLQNCSNVFANGYVAGGAIVIANASNCWLNGTRIPGT